MHRCLLANSIVSNLYRFLIISLQGCDVVMGIPWLQELGSIYWNFKECRMQCSVNIQSFILKGIQPGEVNFSKPNQTIKTLLNS